MQFTHLTRTEARERRRLATYAEDCRRSARMLERFARQARRKLHQAQDELADLERLDFEIAQMFDRAN